jgi:cyanophycin synthetase
VAALEHLMHWSALLLEKAGHPVFTRPKLQRLSDGPAGSYAIGLVCLNAASGQTAMNCVLRLMNEQLTTPAPGAPEFREKSASVLAQARQSLAQSGLQGFNPLHFLSAASELGVAWSSLAGTVFQFGQGARARCLDSSFTDATGRIATLLSRNKAYTASVLRLAGLPVAQHFSASSEDDAVHQAERLGYPVVVKPADLDGGKGVATHLATPQAVRQAFAAALKLSKNVLVEQHVQGRDFRVQVVQNEVHGVLERVPGAVTGNGLDTVRSLLERQNSERANAKDDRRFLKQMAFDDEAAELLATQGLDWESVPAADRFVRLRGAANVESGGVPVLLPLDQVHPDNLQLALRAARVLRLDVAGVDLLLADAARSWFDSGANICEVNAQPQMFTTMHLPMLKSLLRGGNGRIPVAVIVGDSAPSQVGPMLHRQLIASGLSSGLARSDGVWIGTQRVTRGAIGSFDGGRVLLHDPAVQAMVLCVSDHQVLTHGWPVDHCDVLLLAPQVATAGANFSLELVCRFARSLTPGSIVVDGADAASAKQAHLNFGQHSGLQIIQSLGLAAEQRDAELATVAARHLLTAADPAGPIAT